VPDGVIQSLAWLNHETCIFILKTPTMPGDIWQLNVVDETVERLTYISHSDSVGHLWVKPTLKTYTLFDGLDIPYFLYDKGDVKYKPAVCGYMVVRKVKRELSTIPSSNIWWNKVF